MESQMQNRPDSGSAADLDWLQRTSSNDLAMDEVMLFGSVKDTFAPELKSSTDLFEDGLQLPMPAMDDNKLFLPAPPAIASASIDASAAAAVEEAPGNFVNPAELFGASSVHGDAAKESRFQPQADAKLQEFKNLPQLSIDTDIVAPQQHSHQQHQQQQQLPVLMPMSAQSTPAWMNAATPFSAALPSGLMNLNIMTPKTSTSTLSTADPLQLGPGWTETVQMTNLVASDGSGQMFADIAARIDRGFFLTENDWVCYRRNYFQVSSTLSITYQSKPEVKVTRPTEVCVDLEGNLVPVRQFIIQLSSKNSHSDKKIELVQHTAKRDKGPQSIPCRKMILPGGDITSAAMSMATIATYERLQFRSATANNGKRRAHQQYYSLYLELIAQIGTGEEILVAKCESAPLVVRGRSPGHYAAHEQRANKQRMEQSQSPLLSAVPQTPLTGYLPNDNMWPQYSPVSMQQQHTPLSPFPESATVMMNDMSLLNARPQQSQQQAFGLEKHQQMDMPTAADGFFRLDMIAPDVSHNKHGRDM